MAKARIYQKASDVQRLGRKAAPWYVEWREGGKRLAQKVGAKMHAGEVARQVERNLIDHGAGMPGRKPWAEFRRQYEEIILPGMRSPHSRAVALHCLDLFEKIARPGIVGAINRQMLDEYVAKRRDMPGRKPRSTVSAETIRKELRTIRAALAQAHEWDCLPKVPSMPRVDGFETVKRFVLWEHFKSIWYACDQARKPSDFASPADWWRALLLVFWSSGVRVGAILTAEWNKTDLAAGTIFLPATKTKQKKVHVLQIGPAVQALLAIRPADEKKDIIRLPGTVPKDDRVFPWNHHRRTLDLEWDRIQTAAGIHLLCNDPMPHECTPSCHLYGFHDMRRSFATYNHNRMEFEQMMEQMGHSCRATTEGYIVYAEKASPKKFEVYMPEVLTHGDQTATKTISS